MGATAVRGLLLAVAMGWVAQGCGRAAAPPEEPDAGEDGGQGGGAGGGQGGGGVAGGAGGGAGGGGGSGGGAAGGAGGGSAVCNPTAQQGCVAPNTKCGLLGNKFGCQPPGAADAGQPCTATAAGDGCLPGMFCFGGKCTRFCDASAGASACPTGSVCSLRVTWNGGPPQGEVFDACVSNADECHALKQDCADTSTACYVTNAGNKCLLPGAVVDGQACQLANDCKRGSNCFNVGAGFRCYSLCTPASPDGGVLDAGVRCASGTCASVGGGYGVCR